MVNIDIRVEYGLDDSHLSRSQGLWTEFHYWFWKERD